MKTTVPLLTRLLAGRLIASLPRLLWVPGWAQEATGGQPHLLPTAMKTKVGSR